MKNEILFGWAGLSFAAGWALMQAAGVAPHSTPFITAMTFYSWVLAIAYPFLLPFGLKKVSGVKEAAIRMGGMVIMLISSLPGRDVSLNLSLTSEGSWLIQYAMLVVTMCGALSFPFLLVAFMRHQLPRVPVVAA